MNTKSRVRWGAGMVTVIAIVALIVYLWRAGLTRAAEISGVGVFIVAIMTLVREFLIPSKSSKGEEPTPATTTPHGRTAVPGSAHPQASQTGASSGESSAARGAQQRSARARGAPPAMDDVISRVLDLLAGAHIGETESERIAAKASIDISGVSWRASPQDFWWYVVNRAHTAEKMEKLFEAADHVFDENPKWADAKQDYLTARDG